MPHHLSEIQKQINQIDSGYCVFVKLINYDELLTIYPETKSIINDLHQIIRASCILDQQKLCIYSKIEYDSIFLVAPQIEEALFDELIYQIYKDSQLYSHHNLNEVYMDCKITSIDFDRERNDAQQIYALLASPDIYKLTAKYHYKYDAKSYNIQNIQTLNIQVNSLRQAIKEGKIQFDYQPIIDASNGLVEYYECLLRNKLSPKSLASIGSLIHLIEYKGLIHILDNIVIEMAIHELVQKQDIVLSVNISNIGTVNNHLLNQTIKLLKEYHVGERLIIEITETSLNQEYDLTKNFIEKLRNFGCKFAIDDFGSGFTSFNQIRNLPIDIIKIDGSYIKTIETDIVSKYFIEALVKIAEAKNIKLVAEFVENENISRALINININIMQGNFFYPASPKFIKF